MIRRQAMRSSTTLPPLHALRAFEAVARLLSFRRAGEELLITQSAVSHHIRTLEQDLGTRLFIRKARGIELTPEGKRYFATIRRAFALIASGTSDLRGGTGKARVRVSLLPSFAANWLVPRLGRFAKAHPDIELALDPTLRLARLDTDDADIAIRYGDGRWKGVECRLLMAERLTPVVSPVLLRRGPVSKPADLLKHPLLMPLHPYEWEAWAKASGMDLAKARTIHLSDYNIVVQAAVEGQGIAIGRLLLIANRIRNGTLVQPCPKVVTSPRAGHWLVMPKRSSRTAATETFVEWLINEAAVATTAFNQ